MSKKPQFEICTKLSVWDIGHKPIKTYDGRLLLEPLYTIAGYPTWEDSSPDRVFLNTMNKKDLRKCTWFHLFPNWGMSQYEAERFIEDYKEMVKGLK